MEHYASIDSSLYILKNINYTEYTLDILYITLRGGHKYFRKINSESRAITIIKKLQNNREKCKKFCMLDHFIQYIRNTDVVFSLLHGDRGEDGMMQGFLETLNIKYIGSNIHSSSLTINKIYTKKILHNTNICIPAHLKFSKNEFQINSHYLITKIKEYIQFPLIVKPINCGSSIGVTKVKNDIELYLALSQIFSMNKQAIIEKLIIGRELEVSILENIDGSLNITPPGEIIVNNDLYHYECKYIKKHNTQLITSAKISHQCIKTIQALSNKIFKIFDCRGMARIDFFIELKTQNIFFNEINTIPGFTQDSLFPRLLIKQGFTPSVIIHTLANVALKTKAKNCIINKTP